MSAQRFPDAPADTDAAQSRRDAANPAEPDRANAAGSPESRGLRVLETIVYGFMMLAALLALSLVRSFWSTRRQADAHGDAATSRPTRDIEERSA